MRVTYTTDSHVMLLLKVSTERMDGIVLLFPYLSELSLEKTHRFLILHLSFLYTQKSHHANLWLGRCGNSSKPLNGSTLKLFVLIWSLANLCNGCLCTLLGNVYWLLFFSCSFHSLSGCMLFLLLSLVGFFHHHFCTTLLWKI